VLAEHIVGQQLMAMDSRQHRKSLFWVREKADASAKLDFIYANGTHREKQHLKSQSKYNITQRASGIVRKSTFHAFHAKAS